MMKPATVHLTHDLARTSDNLPWMACGKLVLDAPHTLDIRDVTCKACLNSVAGKQLLGEPLNPVTVHLTHDLAQTSDNLPWMACGKLVHGGAHTLNICDVTCKACLKALAGQKLLQNE